MKLVWIDIIFNKSNLALSLHLMLPRETKIKTNKIHNTTLQQIRASVPYKTILSIY